jgi:hypothetical protein
MQPVNLEDRDFTFGVMEEGDYEGLPFVGIKATNFEKGNCITLKNVYLEHEDDRFHRIPDDVSDKYSIYKLLTLHLCVFCPPGIGRIFRRTAYQSQLKVSGIFSYFSFIHNLTFFKSITDMEESRTTIQSESKGKWCSE